MTEVPPDAGPVDRLRPGTLLREWRIERFVARGAFGQVFEARRASWRADEPPRALKVFDPILSSAARASLVGEFEMLRRTQHPNLLRGEDAFDVEDGPLAGCVAFVLELADTDLASELGRRGPLPAVEVAAIGAQAASGLAALHAGEHLHGDVKPANLLRVGPIWKLGDFGVSSAVQGSYSVAPGATLDYSPPELSTEGSGFRVHRSADVWALGVTLWTAATGQHPFAGATPYTRHAAALRGHRAPARIDPELAALVDHCCLAPDPRVRSRAAELAQRLHALTVRLTNTPAARAAAPVPQGPIPPSRIPPGPIPSSPIPPSPVPEGARRGVGTAAGVAAGVAVAVTAGVVEVSSLLAAATPFDLTARRAVYLVLALAALAAAGWALLRRLGSPAARWSAAAGAAVTLLAGTAWLFWGG